MAPVNTTGNWYPACYVALCPETGVTHCTNPSLGHVGGFYSAAQLVDFLWEHTITGWQRVNMRLYETMLI